MGTIRLSVILASLFILFNGCTQKTDNDFNQGLSLYNQNKLQEALPFLEKAVIEGKTNSNAYAYLAETYRRLGNREKALELADNAIALDSCNSFVHTTLSYTFNPMYGDWPGADREKSWNHIIRGIECNPDDGNVWLAAWTEAIFRKDKNIERESLRRLVETGFLTPAILAFNRWMLKDLPPNAILLTNGDMDTYPAVALQETEAFRNDVVIMNYSLLNTRWYQQHIEENYGIRFPFSEEELDALAPQGGKEEKPITIACQIMNGILKAKAERRFDNPMAIAISVGDSSFAEGFENHFVLKGAFKLWTDEPTDVRYDLDAIRASLQSINISDFSGPFVSDADRSPVRIVSTGKIALNFPDLAILFIEKKIDMNKSEEALEMIRWAENINNTVVKDAEISARLNQLKISIQGSNG